MAFSPFYIGIFSTPVGNLFLKVSGRISLSHCLITTRKAAGTAKAVDLNSALAGQGIAAMINAEKAVLVRCVYLIFCLPGNSLASF